MPVSGVSVGDQSFAVGGLIAGRYLVERELGRGGMGVVYLVKDQKLHGKEVALKLISAELTANHQGRDRFIQEVLAAQELTHPNVVKVFHLDEVAGQSFFTMEYVPGRSLREVVEERKRQGQPFCLKECEAVLMPVLKALHHAHTQNPPVIHRDIKPDNIIVTGDFPNPQVKVLDFGLAKMLSPSKLTTTAMTMGTAYYMAPEQVQGAKDIDQRADLFSVGVVLYEMLTGRIPSGFFSMPSELDETLPESVDDVIKQTLQQIPDKRFSSARELAGALESLVRDADEEARRKEREAAEAELRKQREAEEVVKRQVEAEARRVAQEEALRKAEEEAKRKVAEAKVRAEEQARKQAELDARMKIEAEARRQAEEAAKRKAEDEAKRRAEEDARRQAAKEAKQKEVEEARRREQEELRRREHELARRKAEKELMRQRLFWVAALGAVAMLAFFLLSGNNKLSTTSNSFTNPPAPSTNQVKYALTIRPEPSDAKVEFVNKYATYQAGMKLVPGTYAVRVSKSGYMTKEYVARIKDQAVAVDVRLEKASSAAKPPSAEYALTIRPTPSDAQVKILNIKPKYQDGIKVEPGQYKIEVSKPGYKTLRGTVDVVDRDVVAKAELAKEPEVVQTPVSSPRLSASSKGDTWRDPVTGMEFVWVQGGCYRMGSKDGYDNELPVHEACVDGFWMGRYEVTQAEWRRVMGNNPSRFKGDRNPVEGVSWSGAQEFIRKLNASGNGRFRLPTEAEWEYAARSGGRNEKYAGDNDADRVAWYGENSGGKTHPVGTKAPNGLGLYDMSGNVWEWCQDVYDFHAYSEHSRNNPVISEGLSSRVSRGGSWDNSPGGVRAAGRYRFEPGNRFSLLGFRLVRTK